MIIPFGFAEITHTLETVLAPYPANVVYGVELASGVPFQDQVDIIADAFADEIVDQLSNATSLTSTRMKVGPNSTGQQVFSAVTRTGAGGTDAAPPNVAYLVGKTTATGGRTGRGRMYLPGVVETAVTGGGTINSTPLSNLQIAVDDFLGLLQTANSPMVLLHQDGGSSDDTPHEVTALTVRNRVATQRRRLRR